MAYIMNIGIAEEETSAAIDFSKIIRDDDSSSNPLSSQEKKKRGRPPKQQQQQSPAVVDSNGVVMANPPNNGNIPMWQSNESYMVTYQPTNAMLYGVIQEVDSFSKDVREQIDIVKDSKTIRGKYGYISDLTQSASRLIDTKLSAIKEINSTINNAHKLDLQRTKDLRVVEQANAQNDDKYIMDLYNAMINTPIGMYNGPGLSQGPSMQDITLNNMSTGIVGVDMSMNNAPVDIGYAQYQSNKTPEQNRMTVGVTNPNIKTVVIYDQTTQSKRFDNVDTSTGMSVPNLPLPNPAFLDDTTINISNGVARNSNLDTVYPLIVVGSNLSGVDL